MTDEQSGVPSLERINWQLGGAEETQDVPEGMSLID
jgi:hypothetical protein